MVVAAQLLHRRTSPRIHTRIAAAAPDNLAEQGGLALEIGADMAGPVSALCGETGRYRSIEIFQDYAGRDRVILAEPGKS